MTEGLAAAKAAARKAAFARRQVAFDADRQAGFPGVAAANDALWTALAGIGPGPVAGYLPIRSEMSPLPVMTRLAAVREVCVPVMRGSGQALDFHRWTPDCALVKGPFGVMIPADAIALDPVALIVPLVAFDADAGRLGYGGGFYDRSLAERRAQGPLLAIGLAYAAQAADGLPREATDQPLDALITEQGARPASCRAGAPAP